MDIPTIFCVLLAGCKRSAHNIMEQCPQQLPRFQAESQRSSITPEHSASLFYWNQFCSPSFHCGSSVAAPASLPPSTTNQWGHPSPQHPLPAPPRSHSQG